MENNLSQLDGQEPQQPKKMTLEELMREADQQAMAAEQGNLPAEVASEALSQESASHEASEGESDSSFAFAFGTSEENSDVHTNESQQEESSSRSIFGNTEEVEQDVPTVSLPQESEEVVSVPEVHNDVPLTVAGATPKEEIPVVVGPSVEEISQELEESQDWEEEVRIKEKLLRRKHVPVLPILLSVLFVLFTTLFFGSPGADVGNPLQVTFLASVMEGDARIFEDTEDTIVERSSLNVGDIVQTYDQEAVIGFFDSSKMYLAAETQMQIVGMSREEGVIQIELRDGTVWVDDKNIDTRIEIFAHGERQSDGILAMYRSYLGTYAIERSNRIVSTYSATAPVFVVFERDNKETRTLIPPFSAARIGDTQIRENVYDLAYSKATTEFKIRSYFEDFQRFRACKGADCEENGAYDFIFKHLQQSQLYSIALRTDGEFLLNSLALSDGSLRLFMAKEFPYLTFSSSRMEQDKQIQAIVDIASVLAMTYERGFKASTEKELQEVLDQHIFSYEDYARLAPLFHPFSEVTPIDDLYPVKMFLRDYRFGLLSAKDQDLALEQSFIERNTEYYRLVFLAEENYILENLPNYLREVYAFVQEHPESVHLIEEARILTENMLVAIPRLFQTDIFEARFALEELELLILSDEERIPLTLEFARVKLDVMEVLFGELSTTGNEYLRRLYTDRMDELIVQFEALNIESIRTLQGPVRLLQQDFAALRQDYLVLKGVAPSEEVEQLREASEREIALVQNTGVSRQPTDGSSVVSDATSLRRQAQMLLSEMGLSLLIHEQDLTIPRLFTVQGKIFTTTFTARYNVETNVFSQIVLGTQQLSGVVAAPYMRLYLEEALKSDTDVVTETNDVERNYYLEQLQVARRKRIYDALLKSGIGISRISDITPIRRDNADDFVVSNAFMVVQVEVADGKQGLTKTEEHELGLQFQYNLLEDVVAQLEVTLPSDSRLQIAGTLTLNKVIAHVSQVYKDQYMAQQHALLAASLLKAQGITITESDWEVSGEEFQLYTFSDRVIDVGAETPVTISATLDVKSTLLADVTWTYEDQEYRTLNYPVDTIRQYIRDQVRAIEQKKEDDRRAEELRKQQEEAARLDQRLKEQEAKFQQEALEFYQDTTLRD